MASLGINFCTAALGLKVRGGMKKGDLVTVIGAAIYMTFSARSVPEWTMM